MSSRTFCQENFFNSSASSASASVTAADDAVRSSPRKLQSRSQTTLPSPKKGRVCRASRSLPRAVSASPPLPTLASMVSCSLTPSAADHCWKSCLARCFTAKSSSPQTSASGWEFAPAISVGFQFAAGFVHLVEDFAHVLHLLEHGAGHKNRFFLRGSQRQAVARTRVQLDDFPREFVLLDRKSTRLNSSHANISYAVFCLKKK